MTTYLLKRFLLMIPTLIGISIITFALSRAAPGDPVSSEMGGGGGGGGGASAGGAETLKELNKAVLRRKKELGLDRSYPVQYAIWLGLMNRVGKDHPDGILQGNFGESTKYHVPVTDKIGEAIGITLQLNLISISLIYLISIPLGIHAAIRRGKTDEKLIGVTLFGLYSAPSFWVATLLLFYFANPAHLYWFDGLGLQRERYEELPYLDQLADWVWHLVLPVICMTYGGLASLSRYARAGMLETIRKDYVRTARAKGLPERVVIIKHALRNALIPIITLLANLLPAMIGGSVVIEYIFTINGMGKLSFDAILSRDYDMIMAFSMLSAVMVLLGMLLSDLLYTVVDPRISLEG